MNTCDKASPGLITIGLLAFSTAIAGGWDIGPFDNDDALDYVYELQEYDTHQALRQALGKPCVSASYLEAPTGAQAIAAAEVIAAILGNPAANLPGEVEEIVSSYDGRIDAKLLDSAKACVERVLDTESSELAQLWQEVGEFEQWQALTRGLITRLHDK